MQFSKIKMAVILNIQVYFFIFIVFLYTEGISNKRKSVDAINYFLHHCGWKNINDVELIKYMNNEYKFDHVINNSVTYNSCNKYIRNATIILGCSYANDLNTMFFAINNFQEHCTMLLNSKNSLISANKCTVKLIEKTEEIVPMAILMKEALNAIEIFHNRPWGNHNKKKNVILNEVIKNLQQNETIIKLIPLSINMNLIDAALSTIKKFVFARRNELKADMEFCQLKPLELNSEWHLWKNEFNTLKTQGKYQEFFIFLSDKISSLVLTTYQKKFVELGFVFDSNTNRTFLSIPPNNIKQDVKRNQIINSIKLTNDVDVMELIKQQELQIKNEEENYSDVIIEYPENMKIFNPYDTQLYTTV
ncbi:uncharacterized protein LOC126894797 [Daktulosphaira vitifoliae]|uniref:uncharacterized protein LOC126894797 n=1 Tax=Daktulosphaira vitifoliae TaxID=58002 RepID=UPI0021AAE07B|nr:uncharacterized protein LOC126894797 [Daktulosphaira vitifoliae]XP_050522024.1 uncharacterized protein LOC126894797 [Daktulosphaira vitifoliae]